MSQCDITQYYGREIQRLPSYRKQKLLRSAANYWRSQGFPYIKLSRAELEIEYRHFAKSLSNYTIAGNVAGLSTVGLKIANSFHPQMWHIPSQGHSRTPIDHFNDDGTLQKLLERAARFWPDRQCWSAYSVRNIFRVYAGGRVSNFRPTIAWSIMNDMAPDGGTVLDFCAGFGGRLLGTIPLDRHYIGIDPAKAQIRGLKKMVSSLKYWAKCTTELINGCAEEIMPLIPSSSVDLVFTSPPYFNLERYCSSSDQSYSRYQSYSLWKQEFLQTVIEESHRILKPKGKLVINISNLKNFKIADDLQFITKPLFRHTHQISMSMPCRPLQRVNGSAYRHEPIFVFNKK